MVFCAISPVIAFGHVASGLGGAPVPFVPLRHKQKRQLSRPSRDSEGSDCSIYGSALRIRRFNMYATGVPRKANKSTECAEFVLPHLIDIMIAVSGIQWWFLETQIYEIYDSRRCLSQMVSDFFMCHSWKLESQIEIFLASYTDGLDVEKPLKNIHYL